MGDTAMCINPNDPKNQWLKGKKGMTMGLGVWEMVNDFCALPAIRFRWTFRVSSLSFSLKVMLTVTVPASPRVGEMCIRDRYKLQRAEIKFHRDILKIMHQSQKK